MALPIIPLLIIGVGLAACTAAISKSASPERQLFELAGSEWGFGDGTDRFVQFKSEGELIGSGGCNNFFGTYDLNGTKLKVGPIAATKKYCQNQMDAERAFLDALKSARRIEATHLKLKLFDADGNELAALKRRDWD